MMVGVCVCGGGVCVCVWDRIYKPELPPELKVEAGGVMNRPKICESSINRSYNSCVYHEFSLNSKDLLK